MRPALFALLLTALPSLALPGLAEARCLSAADLATGITFKRQDGRTGFVVAQGKTLAIDYSTNSKGAWTDERHAIRGIYEQDWIWTPTEEFYVGGSPGGSFTFKRTGKPPEPQSGKSWKTKVSTRLSIDDGTEYGPQITKRSAEATYSFQPVTEAKLSGCTYRILPVEATFLGKDTHVTQRWIYFPDLGFGLETRVTNHLTGTDRKLGLTALKPKG